MKTKLPWLKFLCCFSMISCNIPLLYSQDIQWEKSYGGKHAEYLFDAIPTPDYGFILAGSSLSKKTGTKTEDNRGDLDYWVWKMDEKGEPDWQKAFGGTGQDMLYSVILTNDGGFLLAGSSESGEGLDKKDKSQGNTDFWIIKLNAKGGEEWQKTIGGNGQDELKCAVRTKDGGFVLAGSSASGISGDKKSKNYGGMDYWVVKVDQKGAILWQQSFGGMYNDELQSIVLTEDDGLLVGGSSNSPDTGTKTQKSFGESDYWIIKLDKDGNEQWQKTIGASGDDQLKSMLVCADGNYLLGGNSNSESDNDKRSSNQSGTDFWVLKIDKDSREIIWQENYNIAKTDILTSMVENEDQTILLGGFAQGEMIKPKKANKALGKARKGLRKKEKSITEEPKMKKGTDDYVAIKINAKGEELWRKDVGSDGQDLLIKAIETRDGGYLMAGTSKTVLTEDGGIKATGNKSSGKGSHDFWVVKLKDKEKKDKPAASIEAIPNPATDYTNVIVGFDYTKGTATLVDLAGRVLQQFKINERTIPIDLSGLPEGIYVVNIKTDKGSEGVKIIKARNKN